MPALVKAWDAAPATRSAQGEARRPDRAAARVGSALVARRRLPTSLAIFWGDRRAAARRGRARRGRAAGRVHRHARIGRRPAAGARRRVRPTGGGLRHVEDAVGRHQSLPAPHRRHRAIRSTTRAEHSGRVHVGDLGIAGVVRRARVPGHEEVVRHERQQLRGGRRVRRHRARQGRHGRRRERRSEVEALQRSGEALQRPAICARCTSTRRSSRGTPSASTIRASDTRTRPSPW